MSNITGTHAMLFPLARCPACGYELTGLVNPGRCPECGEAYDNTTLVLFGWSKNRFRSPGAAAVYALAICFGVMLCCDGAIGVVGIVGCAVRGLRREAWIASLLTLGYFLAGAGLIFVAIRTRRRKQRQMLSPDKLGAPTVQLQISPAGYGARRGYGAVTHLHWIRDMEVDVSREGAIVNVRIARVTPVGVIDWSTVVEIAFAGGLEQEVWLREYIGGLRSGENSSTNFPHPGA